MVVLVVIGLCLLGLQFVQCLHVLHVWLAVVVICRSKVVVEEITLSFRFKLSDEARAEAGRAIPVKHRVRVERACYK